MWFRYHTWFNAFSMNGHAMTTVSTNPMVEYLNSLRTQQQSSNATYIHEARHEFLLSLKREAPWFPDENELYVRTRLDALVDDIVAKETRIRLLFLTGDAGDGKTALCAALARRLGFEGELQWETIIGGWTIIKDASEVEPEILARRIEEQLQPTSEQGLIVAINEGRLRRLFSGLSPQAQALWKEIVEPALEGWLNEQGAQELDRAMRREAIVVVNFRHRFHVRTVTPNLLAKWTRSTLWEQSPACGACGLRERCPILANVQDLRSSDVHGRISDVLAYAHFSGQRLPFRRLQAVLATAATGGLGCTDVQSPALAAATDLLPYRFYNALFLRDELRVPVAVRPEPMARSFAGADPAALVTPKLDRQILALLGPSSTDPTWSDRPLPALEADAVRTMRLRLSPGARTRRYARVHHDELADRVLDLMAQHTAWHLPLGYKDGVVGAERVPSGAYLGDRDMFLFLVDGNRNLEDPSDASQAGLFRGFMLRNSDVGAAALSLDVFLFRAVCGNHIIWGFQHVAGFRRRHIGASIHDAWTHSLREVRALLDADVATDRTILLRATSQEIGATRDEVIDGAAQRLELSRKQAGDAYTLAEQHERNPRSVWGYVQGLTRLSQQTPWQDTRLALDRAASRLLTTVN